MRTRWASESDKSERVDLRASPEALETIHEAARFQQQDLTSFVVGAALERARAVLAEDRLLRLTAHEVTEPEKALDAEPQVAPQLAVLFRHFGAAANHDALSSQQRWGDFVTAVAPSP